VLVALLGEMPKQHRDGYALGASVGTHVLVEVRRNGDMVVSSGVGREALLCEQRAHFDDSGDALGTLESKAHDVLG
jgi:hypothetical protein